MTRADALAEARKRWGADGAVRVRYNTLSHLKFSVGRRWRIRFYSNGSGDSWEAAFADADRGNK